MSPSLKSRIPPGLKAILRRVMYFPEDAIARVTGRRDMYTPPKGLMFIGTSGFKEVGQEFLRYFVDLAGLKPEHRVLDVGCGLGRMAVPLIGYLNKEGSYDGFDVVGAGIRWATRTITSRNPRFRFLRADLYNQFYNPRAAQRSSEYRFPYGSASFDFVFLGSVFTHMLPPDVDHFLDEIVRVMKPGATCLITYFLLNDESRALLAAGRSTQPFMHTVGPCLSVSAATPEAAIAYPEELIRARYGERGLAVIEPPRYGRWCGREKYLSYQDIVIARLGPSTRAL